MKTCQNSSAVAWHRIDKRKLLLRFAIELGPPLAFALALQVMEITRATAVLIAAIAVSAAYSWFEKRHFPYIPAGLLLLAAVFGGLTILYGDAAYIEVRATIINGGGALALLVGLLRGRLLLKDSLQEGFSLNDRAWRWLTVRMIVYLTALAISNELVRYFLTTEAWAWFRVAVPVLNILFLAANWPLIRDNIADDEGTAGEDRTSGASRVPGTAPAP